MSFQDPAVRARAQMKSLETRRQKAEARHQELEARRRIVEQAGGGIGMIDSGAEGREAAAAAAVAAAAELPSLDNLFELPAARRADVLDIKLAGMKAGTGAKGRQFVRPVTTATDVTRRDQIYHGEGKPRQVHSIVVDSVEPGKMVVYDNDFQPRAIPEQNFRVALASGLHFVCPGCGGEHLKEVVVDHDHRGEPILETVIDWDVDACPALEKVMKMRCPECAKHRTNMVIPDRPPSMRQATKFVDDANFVDFDAAIDDDPVTAAKKRLRNLMSEHMAWVHPSEAALYGIDVADIRARTSIGAPANTSLVR